MSPTRRKVWAMAGKPKDSVIIIRASEDEIAAFKQAAAHDDALARVRGGRVSLSRWIRDTLLAELDRRASKGEK
jgi:hypothetical protein